jgi:putative hydroxymethylpyrimidine transport system ATP-binding protein
MQEWLMRMWEQHRMTVLFITHDVEEALLLADRVLVVTEAPVSRLHEVPVPIARPRHAATTVSGEFVELKRELLALLSRYAHAGGETGGGAR